MHVASPHFFQRLCWNMITWVRLGLFTLCGCIALALVWVASPDFSRNLAHLQTLVQTDRAVVCQKSWKRMCAPAWSHLNFNERNLSRDFAIPPWLQSVLQPGVEQFLPALHQTMRPYLKALQVGWRLWVLHVFALIQHGGLFLLLGAVAFVDGLVQRAIRRWSGNHERALIYHTAKSHIRWSFILGLSAYFILPVPFPQATWLLAFTAVWVSIAVQITVTHFRKYV